MEFALEFLHNQSIEGQGTGKSTSQTTFQKTTGKIGKKNKNTTHMHELLNHKPKLKWLTTDSNGQFTCKENCMCTITDRE